MEYPRPFALTKNERLRRWLPYGIWICESGREVLFNRAYQPIFERAAPGLPAVPADPNEWIYFKIQDWFFGDRDPPWRNAATLRYCRAVLASWGLPEVTDEELIEHMCQTARCAAADPARCYVVREAPDRRSGPYGVLVDAEDDIISVWEQQGGRWRQTDQWHGFLVDGRRPSRILWSGLRRWRERNMFCRATGWTKHWVLPTDKFLSDVIANPLRDDAAKAYAKRIQDFRRPFRLARDGGYGPQSCFRARGAEGEFTINSFYRVDQHAMRSDQSDYRIEILFEHDLAF
jgi:hypothetical protein